MQLPILCIMQISRYTKLILEQLDSKLRTWFSHTRIRYSLTRIRY